MANSNKPYNKKKIQETEDSGFGHYDEGVGGGGSPEPMKPGTHGHGVNSDHRKQNNDTMQPRTEDGKFTYKSVNGQSIDPKYGPSRGKTVNPLLTGGKNGIKIANVKSEFAQQSGAYWDKYKDKWYQKGGEIVTSDLKTRVAGAAIWDIAKRRYDKVKGEFEGESHTFDETKKGRVGQEEKAAKQQVESTGEEASVIDKTTGGIKLKPGTPKEEPVKPVQPTPTPVQPNKTTPVVPNQPTSQPSVQTQPSVSANVPSQTNTVFGKKYNAEQVGKVKDLFKKRFGDKPEQLNQLLSKIDSLTPEQLDAQIDYWVSKNIDFGFDNTENKIKEKMGLN